MRWRRAEDIGNRIRELRVGLGLTQDQFGEVAGVEGQQVSDWETGRSRPRTNRLERLARTLRIPVQVFQEGGPTPTVALEARKSLAGPSNGVGGTSGGPQPRGPGRRREDLEAMRRSVELEVARKQRDAARLEVLRERFRAYRLAGKSAPPEILEEWEAIARANSLPENPPAGPRPGPAADPGPG